MAKKSAKSVVETFRGYDPHYDAEVVRITFSQVRGEVTTGDRHAVAGSEDGAKTTWDLWQREEWGWCSNPFGLLAGQDDRIYTEKEARAWVETGTMPQSYELLLKAPRR